MVFPHLISLYKFAIIMKHMTSQKFIISSTVLLITYLSFSFITINTLPECGTPFHGILDYDIDCDEDVLITSFPEDAHGTVIVTSVAFKGKLRITPGASSVKILPDLSNSNLSARRRLLPKRPPGTTRKELKNEKPEPSEPAPLNYTITNQYIGIADATAPIIHYSMYSLDGMPVIEVNHKQPLNFQVPIDNLSSDIYILILQLENGDVHSKTFAKL